MSKTLLQEMVQELSLIADKIQAEQRHSPDWNIVLAKINSLLARAKLEGTQG